jgi:hypothetical protein
MAIPVYPREGAFQSKEQWFHALIHDNHLSGGTEAPGVPRWGNKRDFKLLVRSSDGISQETKRIYLKELNRLFRTERIEKLKRLLAKLLTRNPAAKNSA